MLSINEKGVIAMIGIGFIIAAAISLLVMKPEPRQERQQIVLEAEAMSRTSGKAFEGGVLLDRNAGMSSALNFKSEHPSTLTIIANGTRAELPAEEYELLYFITGATSISEILNSGTESDDETFAVEVQKIAGSSITSEQTLMTYGEMKGILDTASVPYKTSGLPTGELAVESVKVLHDLKLSRKYRVIHVDEGWPVLDVFIDGKPAGSVKVSSAKLSAFTLNLAPLSNPVLELRFNNWQNQSNASRNLFIDKLIIEEKVRA